MGLDTTISRSKKVMTLMWSVLIFILIILFVYYLIKNAKNKKRRNKLLSKLGVKRSQKSEINDVLEDEPSDKENRNSAKQNRKKKLDDLIEPPVYNFSDCKNRFEPVKDRKYAKKHEFYNYKDLINIMKSDDSKFFDEYLESVRKSYDAKLELYRNIYNDTRDLYKQNLNKDQNQGHTNESADFAMLLMSECRDIIKQIKHRQTNLTAKSIKDDFKRIIWDRNEGTESLVGRLEIKNLIARTIFDFKKNPVKFIKSFKNFIIMGGSGIGKSKLGRCIAHAYSKCGIMVRDRCTIMPKTGIVSAFVSASGSRSDEILIKHLEGLIIWEEIYDLVPPKELSHTADHGREVINSIVFMLEKYPSIIAGAIGYEEPMRNQFLASNEGMHRRFPEQIVLKSYNSEELSSILIRMLADKDMLLGEEEAQYLHEMIVSAQEHDPDIFELEAGELFNLSAQLTNVSNTIKNHEWVEGETDSNCELLLIGFNCYLSKKSGFILE